jgi:hypothetical protein
LAFASINRRWQRNCSNKFCRAEVRVEAEPDRSADLKGFGRLCSSRIAAQPVVKDRWRKCSSWVLP